jgi:protein-disulfide isomerase
VSCNQVQGDVKSYNELRKGYDSLSTVVKSMHEELEILKWGLSRKGLDIETIRQEKIAEEKVWDIPVDGSPIAGKASAPIMIVEFSDFECPYCARVAPQLKELVEKYPDKVALMFKHFPLSFHKAAPAAHAASIAAHKQGKFWEYRYTLAPHFRGLTNDVFLQVAKEIGLDLAKFQKDMELAGDNQKKIDADMQLGQNVGVRGTPNFYVNGKKSNNFSPQMIEEMVKNLK